MSWVTQNFLDTWRAGRHVGGAAPNVVVEVRRGNFRRDYRSWPQPYVRARIPGESRDMPWYPIFTETTPWLEVPNITDLERQKTLDANGCQVVTLGIDNVGYVAQAGGYHTIDRGFYSPWRRSTPIGYKRPTPPWNATDWSDVLSKNANLRVWVGFGAPQRDGGGDIPASGGDNGTWVFNGLIDSVEADSDPSRLTVVARMGKTLTDEHIFGWVKSRQLRDPITFADRQKAKDAGTEARNWILVDDLSDVVRVCLRWGGFREWEVEDTGVRLKDKHIFNRTSFLIDAIKWACEQTGFIFFIADPDTGASMGVPTFRRPAHLLRDPGAVAINVRDTNLLTGLHAREDEESLPYIIRVRGKEASARDGGLTLGGDRVRRLMWVYRPPWAVPNQDGEMAGIIKHVVHYDTALTTLDDCKMGAYLTAANAALAAYPATGELPGLPLLELDDQVGVLDQATGTNSRVWIEELTERMSIGEQPAWQTSFTGYLIDNQDLVDVIDEILATDFGDTPKPVRVTASRQRRIRA